MKAFLVGLVFLIAVAVLSGIGFLLSPFVFALVFFVRIIVSIALLVFAIWLLGTLIIYVWEKMIR